MPKTPSGSKKEKKGHRACTPLRSSSVRSRSPGDTLETRYQGKQEELFGSSHDGLTITSVSRSPTATADPNFMQLQHANQTPISEHCQHHCSTAIDSVLARPVHIPILNHFDSIADDYSNKQLHDDISKLNHTIDNLVEVILCQLESENLRPLQIKKHQFPSREPIDALFECVKIQKLTTDQRGYLLDALMHNAVCTEVHRAHFSGNNFWGLKDCNLLGELYEQIASKSSWREVQKWRTMTAGAAFMLQESDEAVIDEFCQNLSKRLRAIFVDFNLLAHGNRKVVEAADKIFASPDISRQISVVCMTARSTSRRIQCDILSCRVDIIIANRGTPRSLEVYKSNEVETLWDDIMNAPAIDDETKVIGTYHFGLTTHDEHGKSTILMKPQVILQNFVDTFMCIGQKR